MREGETMVSLEALELEPSFHQRLTGAGGHPEELRARLVSALAEPGGAAGRVVGPVVSSTRPAGRPARGMRVSADLAGARVALVDITGWDGETERVPVRDGYAILPASAVLALAP